jgi:Rad3-related DNA helicase
MAGLYDEIIKNIKLRPWQEKVLSQIPTNPDDNTNIVINAPTGSGKTLLSLLTAIMMSNEADYSVIFVVVRTLTEQHRFWEDILRHLGLRYKPFVFFSKARQCTMMNEELKKELKELGEDVASVDCEGCRLAGFGKFITNSQSGLQYARDEIDTIVKVNPNLPPDEYRREVLKNLVSIGHKYDNICTYDAIKNLSRVSLRLGLPVVLIGTYPHVFGYPHVLFSRLYQDADEIESAYGTEVRFITIVDEAHNLDKLEGYERTITARRLLRVIEYGERYCKALTEDPKRFIIDPEEDKDKVEHAVKLCKEDILPHLNDFKANAEKIGKRLDELAKEYNASSSFKHLRDEHLDELLTMLYEFEKAVVLPIGYIEMVVSRFLGNIKVAKSLEKTIMIMNYLFDFLQHKFRDNEVPGELMDLIDPRVWRFYITKNDEASLVIKPTTPKPIILNARSLFRGPWILMSGTMPPKEYIERVWGLNVTKYFDLSREVRIGHRNVEIITSVTSEFKKRGEEMYRKYADEIRKVVMSGDDGVYLVVYPNYNMMISIANYLMNLPVKQVREGEVKHLPKLLELALTNKKLVIHAVSGGRFTEGIELVKDGKSLIKHIIIAGVPFPNISDDYVRDRIRASGLKDYTWMKIQAEMLAKQAIGRGTRGPEDFVDVRLMDYRFSYLAKSWGLVSY